MEIFKSGAQAVLRILLAGPNLPLTTKSMVGTSVADPEP